MTTAKRATSRPRADGALTRARLLSAAREAFAELGYPATRVADIVARAGTSHGTFYTYFTDKKDVLVALTEETARSLYGIALDPTFEGSGRPSRDEVIRHRTRAFFRAYQEDRCFVHAWMQAAALHPDVDDLRRRIQDSLADTLAALLARDQARGVIDADINVDVAATALTQMVEAFAHRWSARNRDLDELIVEQIAGLWVRALYGRPPQSEGEGKSEAQAPVEQAEPVPQPSVPRARP